MAEKIGLDASEMARLEGLLSDALSGDGNDSVWEYRWWEGCATLGPFIRDGSQWSLVGHSGQVEASDSRENWLRDLRTGVLALVLPASVSASVIQPIARTEAVNQPNIRDLFVIAYDTKFASNNGTRWDSLWAFEAGYKAALEKTRNA